MSLPQLPAPDALEAPGHWKDRAEAFLMRLAEELAPEASEWSVLLAEPAESIEDDAGYAQATACLRTARDAKNDVDARRKRFTEPLHEVKSRIDALFKPLVAATTGLERSYRDRMNAYDTRKEDERRAAARAAAEAVATQTVALAAIPPPPVAPAGVTAKRVWKFRIVDPLLVPRHLCSPDEKKIKAHGPGPGEMPGVEWYEESEVRVR